MEEPRSSPAWHLDTGAAAAATMPASAAVDGKADELSGIGEPKLSDSENDTMKTCENIAKKDTNGEELSCRVCRDGATIDNPLYKPCLCSGSISNVHQVGNSLVCAIVPVFLVPILFARSFNIFPCSFIYV